MHSRGLPAALLVSRPARARTCGALGTCVQHDRPSRCSLRGEGTHPRRRTRPIRGPRRPGARVRGGTGRPRAAAVARRGRLCQPTAAEGGGGDQRDELAGSAAVTREQLMRRPPGWRVGWGADKPGGVEILLVCWHVRLRTRPAPHEPAVHVHSTRTRVKGTRRSDGPADLIQQTPWVQYGGGEGGRGGGWEGGGLRSAP